MPFSVWWGAASVCVGFWVCLPQMVRPAPIASERCAVLFFFLSCPVDVLSLPAPQKQSEATEKDLFEKNVILKSEAQAGCPLSHLCGKCWESGAVRLGCVCHPP